MDLPRSTMIYHCHSRFWIILMAKLKPASLPALLLFVLHPCGAAIQAGLTLRIPGGAGSQWWVATVVGRHFQRGDVFSTRFRLPKGTIFPVRWMVSPRNHRFNLGFVITVLRFVGSDGHGFAWHAGRSQWHDHWCIMVTHQWPSDSQSLRWKPQKVGEHFRVSNLSPLGSRQLWRVSIVHQLAINQLTSSTMHQLPKSIHETSSVAIPNLLLLAIINHHLWRVIPINH